MTTKQVISALSTVLGPDSERDVIRLGMIQNLVIEEDCIRFKVFERNPSQRFSDLVRDQCVQALKDRFGDDIDVHIDVDNEMIGLGDGIKIDGRTDAPGVPDGVLNTIAVASGKGGVGKSTVAVNLAIALADEGYDVGLADVDIYGPSIPTMFGLTGIRPAVNDDRKLVPVEKFGVKLLSMGFLVDPDKAVVWRGPMVSGAVRQFLSETAWGELDFLILDLPPGTGDIQLTIVQTVALSGAVIVSTPQKVALDDARKGVAMFDQVNVPVLGMIENMSYFTPPELPDNKYYIFGQGGARALAVELEIPVLAELPLEPALREACDLGNPGIVSDDVREQFRRLAQNVAHETYLRNVTRESKEKIEITRH